MVVTASFLGDIYKAAFFLKVGLVVSLISPPLLTLYSFPHLFIPLMFLKKRSEKREER
jgi:hypothetical protein